MDLRSEYDSWLPTATLDYPKRVVQVCKGVSRCVKACKGVNFRKVSQVKVDREGKNMNIG